MIPDAQYYPLRFHVLRSMTTLGVATKVFIPLAPYMFELFESPVLAKSAKPSTLKPLEWDTHLRTPQNYLRGRVFQVIYDNFFYSLFPAFVSNEKFNAE